MDTGYVVWVVPLRRWLVRRDVVRPRRLDGTVSRCGAASTLDGTIRRPAVKV